MQAGPHTLVHEGAAETITLSLTVLTPSPQVSLWRPPEPPERTEDRMPQVTGRCLPVRRKQGATQDTAQNVHVGFHCDTMIT